MASRNTEDVTSWIKGNQAPVFVYPLGVSLSDLRSRAIENEEVRRCYRFVYIGSMNEKRKMDKLIRFISELPEDLLQGFSLDCYGAGGDTGGLNDLILQLGLAQKVRMCGSLPQNELFPLLGNYDVGLAWVPQEIYDAAPSIKFLEYAGSGLVVLATNTLGHQRNVGDGFHAVLFSEDAASFCKAVRSIMIDGFPVSKLRDNLETIKRFSWDKVVTESFIPTYQRLLADSDQNSSRASVESYSQDESVGLPVPGASHQQCIRRERFLHVSRMEAKVAT